MKPNQTNHNESPKPIRTRLDNGAATSIMDDAPLFAGLDDVVFVSAEKEKPRPPKKQAPKEKTETVRKKRAPATRTKPQKETNATRPVDPGAILLSVAEMCVLLRISRATLVRMDKAGKIPGRLKVGGSVRFHRETVESWIRNLITPPAA